MPVFLGLLLSIAIGYLFGPLVFMLFGIAIIVVPLFLITKAITKEYLIPYFKEKSRRRKLRKMLKERLKHLP